MSARRRPDGRRREARAVLATIAILVSVAACGGGAPTRVSKADAFAIFQALSNQTSPIFLQGCSNIRRAVKPDTLHAYALLVQVARKNPDALLQSPDFSNEHPPIRQWVADEATVIAYCMAHEPSVGPGWWAANARLEQALATMTR